jgi:uncharacterized membrane protein YfcA
MLEGMHTASGAQRFSTPLTALQGSLLHWKSSLHNFKHAFQILLGALRIPGKFSGIRPKKNIQSNKWKNEERELRNSFR